MPYHLFQCVLSRKTLHCKDWQIQILEVSSCTHRQGIVRKVQHLFDIQLHSKNVTCVVKRIVITK